MLKIARSQFGKEQLLLETVFKLMSKKYSLMFHKPVDTIAFPDYLEKIKKPIDLTTIVSRIKNGLYDYAAEVKDDLQLLIDNCRTYNVQSQVIKQMQKFEQSIKTEWSNFQKDLKHKSISYTAPLQMDEDMRVRLEAVEDKKQTKKDPNQIKEPGDRQSAVPQLVILPQLPKELFQRDANEVPYMPELQYRASNYNAIPIHARYHMLGFNFNREQIGKDFERVSQVKLEKYKKILMRRIMWIEEKIIKKCLERKRFKKMLTPTHLLRLSQEGQIATSLQIKKIQMYVKQVTQWVEQYPQILGYHMKQKFIEGCKGIRQCISRVLKYKKIQRATKIQIDPGWEEAKMEEGEEQANKYENKMKEFKRMLIKDQGETIKKYTKITICHENGEYYVYDWANDTSEKKQKNRTQGQVRTFENTDEIMRIERERERKEQRERDELFLNQYKKKSNVEIILHYGEQLAVDWPQIIFNNVHKCRLGEEEEKSQMQEESILHHDYIFTQN